MARYLWQHVDLLSAVYLTLRLLALRQETLKLYNVLISLFHPDPLGSFSSCRSQVGTLSNSNTVSAYLTTVQWCSHAVTICNHIRFLAGLLPVQRSVGRVVQGEHVQVGALAVVVVFHGQGQTLVHGLDKCRWRDRWLGPSAGGSR